MGWWPACQGIAFCRAAKWPGRKALKGSGRLSWIGGGTSDFPQRKRAVRIGLFSYAR